MAFPLMALGAGIGQFAQEYRQQQESALRQMAAKQQLEHLMQSQRAEELLGSVVRQGGQIPGFGNQSPFGLPQQPGPQAAAAPPIGAPQMPQQAPQPPALPQREVVPPEMDPGPPTPSSNLIPGSIPLGAGEPAGSLLSGDAVSPGAPPASPGIPPPIDPRAAGAESGLPAGASAGDAAAAPAQQDHTAPISSFPEMSQWLGTIHAANPAEIAAHITKIRPDASDGDVWRATATLMKMSGGSLKEQIASAGMMKYLLGEQRRTKTAEDTHQDRVNNQNLRAGIAVGSVGGQKTVAQQQADLRASGQAATQQRSETREKRLTAAFDEKRAERAVARATGDTKMALQSLLSQSRQLKSQIDGIDMGMDAQKPERKAQRAKLQAQMDALGQKIEARTQAIEKAVPAPASE